MVSYKIVFLEFLSKKFGKMIAESLFDIYSKRKNITDLDSLPMSEQYNFIEYMFDNVFGEFYDKSQISNINILCFLRFALAEATQRLQLMFSLKTDIGDFSFETIPEIRAIGKEEFEDKESIYVNFRIEKGITGMVSFIHNKDIIEDFSDKIIEKMMGSDVQKDRNTRISALSEFYNVLLPPFTDVIENTMDAKIEFVPIDKEKVLAKINDGGYKCKTIISATLPVTLFEDIYNIKLYCFIENVDEKILSFITKYESVMEILEKEPVQLVIEKTGDVKKDLIEFLGNKLQFKDGLQTLKKAMDDLSITTIDSYMNMVLLRDYFVDNFFQNASENKKKNIIANFDYIFGFEAEEKA